MSNPDNTWEKMAMDRSQRLEDARQALLKLIEHWDEYSDAKKIRQINDVIEEIL